MYWSKEMQEIEQDVVRQIEVALTCAKNKKFMVVRNMLRDVMLDVMYLARKEKQNANN